MGAGKFYEIVTDSEGNYEVRFKTFFFFYFRVCGMRVV